MISELAAMNAEGWMLGENPEKVSMAMPDVAHRSPCLQACHISGLVRYLTFPKFFLPDRWPDRYGICMKLLMLVVAVVTLNSCNTMIGLGRDTKQGFIWAKDKIQGSGQQDSYGAPTY